MDKVLASISLLDVVHAIQYCMGVFLMGLCRIYTFILIAYLALEFIIHSKKIDMRNLFIFASLVIFLILNEIFNNFGMTITFKTSIMYTVIFYLEIYFFKYVTTAFKTK